MGFSTWHAGIEPWFSPSWQEHVQCSLERFCFRFPWSCVITNSEEAEGWVILVYLPSALCYPHRLIIISPYYGLSCEFLIWIPCTWWGLNSYYLLADRLTRWRYLIVNREFWGPQKRSPRKVPQQRGENLLRWHWQVSVSIDAMPFCVRKCPACP